MFHFFQSSVISAQHAQVHFPSDRLPGACGGGCAVSSTLRPDGGLLGRSSTALQQMEGGGVVLYALPHHLPLPNWEISVVIPRPNQRTILHPKYFKMQLYNFKT